MHNSIEELNAVSLAAKTGVTEPDTSNHPHLPLTRTFNADEVPSHDGERKWPADPYTHPARPTGADHYPARHHQRAQSQLQVFSVVQKTIPDWLLKLAGWKRPKKAPKIIYLEPNEWVDTDTGEILTNAQARKQGATTGPSVSLRTIEIQAFIRQCPPTKRDFVVYILKLRNKRGGLVIDLKTALDRWIDRKHPNIDSTDRARKRESLQKFLRKLDIMADNQTLSKELQVMGYSTKTDYLGEESEFIYAFPIRAKPGCGFQSDPATERQKLSEWFAQRGQTVASVTT